MIPRHTRRPSIARVSQQIYLLHNQPR